MSRNVSISSDKLLTGRASSSSTKIHSLVRMDKSKRILQSRIQTFSTNGDDKSSETNGDLTSTYEQASRINAMATNELNRSTETLLLEARHLLKVTENAPLIAQLLHHSNESKRDISSIHRAFLRITSCCLSHPEKLVDTSLSLTRRARDLCLPFHLPLCERVVSAVAMYSTEEDVAATIMEISSWASLTLQIVLRPSFFHQSVVALVSRNDFRAAIHLRSAVRDRFDIDCVNSQTAMQMIRLIKDKLDENDDVAYTAEDARELVALLQEPIMREMEETERDLMSLSATLNSLLEHEPETLGRILDELETDSDDDGEEQDDEFDISPETHEDLLDEAYDKHNSFESEGARVFDKWLQLQKERKTPSTFTIALQVDQESGKIASMHWSPSESTYPSRSANDYARELLYIRDPDDWKLPDVTEQLTKLVNSNDLRYSEEFEDRLIEQMEDDMDDEF